MRKLALRIFIVFGFMNSANFMLAGTEESELMKLMRDLQRQVESQQREIDALKSRLYDDAERNLTQDSSIESIMHKQERHAIQIEEKIDSYAALAETPGVKLGKRIDGLSIKGDARFRYEARDRNETPNGGVKSKDQKRDRYRLRLRLGLVWQNIEDGWEFGVGLAGGGTGSESSTSTNDTLSESGIFETDDINLDYAYARHSWEDIDLIIGQQKNPWKDTTTYILWDGDVRPVGVTGNYNMKGFFVTGGGYLIRNWNNEEDNEPKATDDAEAILLAGQVGFKHETDDLDLTVALGYWHFNDASVQAVNEELGTTLDENNAEFSLIDVFGRVGTKFGETEVSVLGHYVMNNGADKLGGSQADSGSASGIPLKADDEDTAWLIGGKVGMGPVQFTAEYAHIEADAVYAPIKDSDFGDTAGLPPTNVEGMKLGVKYKFTKTMSLGWTYMDLELIEKTSDYDDMEGELHQLDLVYKF